MNNFAWLCVVAMLAAGCQQSIPVVPIDAGHVLESQALVLMVSNQPGQVADPEPVAPTECLCGGTGRSGDGLGPCACPAGCKCKTARIDGPVVQSEAAPEVFTEYVTIDQFNALEQTVKTLAAELKTNDGRIGDQQAQIAILGDRVESVNDEILAALKAHGDTLDSIRDATEKRISVLEKPIVAEEPQIPRPHAQCIVFKLPANECKFCVVFETRDVPALKKAGWSVGGLETNQIVILERNNDPEQKAKWPEAFEKALQAGVPSYAFYRNGEMVEFIVGYMTADKVADKLKSLQQQ